MILFVIGPSASGKGTQSDLLAQHYHIPHISMGDLFRKEIAAGTDIGKKVEGYVNAGEWVPNDITNELLVNAINKAVEESGGVIIDGYPRQFGQIGLINPWLEKHHGFNRVIHYTLSYEECMKRQKERSGTAGQARADDAQFSERYKEYAMNIEPIVAYYKERGKYIEIDARPSVEEIFATTVAILDKQKDNA